MIEVRDLHKAYTTGYLTQKALDGLSIAFRDNEFVAVLGQSGSGKTTLLNILGGLDRSDSGEIIINGVSTKRYKSADWDTYRNHRIGFVFQSYNLIPHQSVLSNVELALTLSGVPRSERRERAQAALERVGLGEHAGKRPSQLSGGQMQRVAIARAIVNDPEIVLADEPTGALDSDTGVAVMDILKEIASDRLVIMVTHNPELAERYATRIVHLRDGRIVSDSEPVTEAEKAAALAASDGEAAAGDAGPASAERAGGSAAATASSPAPSSSAARSKDGKRARMSFLTALSLSFNNLMTKKGRTFLTAFAGSIGIIGIAAILALSNGVNNYIEKTEREALSSYPISITKSSFDFASLLTMDMGGDDADAAPAADAGSGSGEGASDGASDGSEGSSDERIRVNDILKTQFSKVQSNDLASFKRHLESEPDSIKPYITQISYSYGVEPIVYRGASPASSFTPKNDDPVNLTEMASSMRVSSGSLTTSFGSGGAFSEIQVNQETLDREYDVKAGRWAEGANEAVLVLNRNGMLSDSTLYGLGIYDPSVLEDLTQKLLNDEPFSVPDMSANLTYDTMLGTDFIVLPAAELYRYNEDQKVWTDMSDDAAYVKERLASAGIPLRIVGVVQPKPETKSPALYQGVAYTSALTERLMDVAADAQIVKSQLADHSIDVFTGTSFDDLQEKGSGFDLESMISVDEDALANAFKVDESAFSFDPSAFDFSSISGAIDPAALAAAFQNAPAPDPKLFSDIGLDDLDEASRTQAEQSLQAVAAGFLPYWYAEHPGETITPETDLSKDFQAYAQTEPVRTQLATLSALMGKSTSEYFQKAMTTYMTETYAPYVEQVMQSVMAQAAANMATQMATQMQAGLGQLASGMQNAVSFDPEAFASAIKFNMSEDDLRSLMTSFAQGERISYDTNLKKLGYADRDDPQVINIYPKDFESKEKVVEAIDAYNDEVRSQGEDAKVITYSDLMGALISSVTTIVNMVSYVLIAFVSISLVVSSIMIGIITYISVLERRKEIGILRAMGASKRNIANVFNAETVIEGFISGVFAILVVLLASIPVNGIVMSMFQVPDIMILPWTAGAVLIAISVVLTLIAGLIPSGSAARRDPVEALRSE